MSFIKISLGRIQGQNQRMRKGVRQSRQIKIIARYLQLFSTFFIETSLYSFSRVSLNAARTGINIIKNIITATAVE